MVEEVLTGIHIVDLIVLVASLPQEDLMVLMILLLQHSLHEVVHGVELAILVQRLEALHPVE